MWSSLPRITLDVKHPHRRKLVRVRAYLFSNLCRRGGVAFLLARRRDSLCQKGDVRRVRLTVTLRPMRSYFYFFFVLL